MSESDAYCLMRQHEEIDKLQARVAELEDLLYRVVNHGNATGDKELIADIQRATPEAGWTDVVDNAGGPLTPGIEAWAEGVFANAKGCSTCQGTGKIDERIGGISTSSIVSCPDCSARPRPTPTIDSVPSCGSENDWRNAQPKFTPERQLLDRPRPKEVMPNQVGGSSRRTADAPADNAQPRPAHPEHLSKGLAGADRVDLVAQTMMRGMFAEHELPLSPLLQSRYRLVAGDIIAALDSAAPPQSPAGAKAEYWRGEWRRVLTDATNERVANRILELAEVNGFFADMFHSEPAGAVTEQLREAIEDLISDIRKQMANPTHHMPFSLPKAETALALAAALDSAAPR